MCHSVPLGGVWQVHHGTGHMVGGGGPVRGGRGIHHPLDRTTPQEERSFTSHPMDRTTNNHPPWTGPPAPLPRKERSLICHPPDIHPLPPPPPPRTGPPPPPHMGTTVYAQAGGTHPTGMHSCSVNFRVTSRCTLDFEAMMVVLVTSMRTIMPLILILQSECCGPLHLLNQIYLNRLAALPYETTVLINHLNTSDSSYRQHTENRI